MCELALVLSLQPLLQGSLSIQLMENGFYKLFISHPMHKKFKENKHFP